MWYDEATRAVRSGGVPDAADLAREREQAESQALAITPLTLSIVRPEHRAILTPRVVFALTVAQSTPVPPWLCVHAWRNGLSAAAFKFDLSRGEEAVVAALQRHAAEMQTLYRNSLGTCERAPRSVLCYSARCALQRRRGRLIRADSCARRLLSCQAVARAGRHAQRSGGSCADGTRHFWRV